MGKKIGRVIFHITELFQKRWKKYGFFDFSPLLSSRAKSDNFFQPRAKIYYGITLPTKNWPFWVFTDLKNIEKCLRNRILKFFNFSQISIDFWFQSISGDLYPFQTFVKLNLFYPFLFSRMVWYYFFTPFLTQGWCVLWSYYTRNYGLILKVAQIAWFVSSTIVSQMTSLTLVTTVLFLYFVMVGLSFQYCKL